MILADAAQTMYSRGFSWKQAGIQARGIRYALTEKITVMRGRLLRPRRQLLTHNTLLRATGEYIDPEWTERQGPPPMLIQATKLFHQVELVR